MTLRLYVDHDSSRNALVQALRRSQVDVLTAFEAGQHEAEDADQLAFATAQGRVLYSFHVGDYLRLHREHVAQGRSHAGIILARQQHYSVGEQLRRLWRVLSTRAAHEMVNRVEFLSAWASTEG